MRSKHDLPSAACRLGCRALTGASTVALVACASMAGVGGSAEFGCKAPVGVKCDSVSGTYYNALQQNLPSQQKSTPVVPEASLAPTLMDQRARKTLAPGANSNLGALPVAATAATLTSKPPTSM